MIPAVALALGGCASFNPGDDRPAVELLLTNRGAAELGWEANGAPESDERVRQWLGQPMTAESTVKVAMAKSPRLQQVYGELGLARADVLDAIQVSNPRVGLSSLALANGPGSQFIFGVAAPLVDLITLPAKARLAGIEYERARYEMAAAILGVSLDVEAAWYNYVSAQQVADMRGAVADTLQVSADLAQRFYDAGNITEIQLNREKAAASQARIEAARAKVTARLARLGLNSLMGLSGTDGEWTSAEVLPLPVANEDDPAELQRMAREGSLELLAARKGAAVAEGAARITRSFRLLGTTDIGFDRERETDRSRIRGGTLDIELPVFNQGGSRVARADARLRLARARLRQLELATGNAVVLGEERVRVLAQVVDIYRQALVPEREIVASRSQLEQNYALIGEFEVLLAKTQEYDAYQGLFEAVRDYWLARVELMRLVGGRLPSEAQAKQLTPATAEIVPRLDAAEPVTEHHHHGDAAPEPVPEEPPAEHHHHGVTS